MTRVIFCVFTKSYTMVKLWYQNLKLDKTCLPEGYLISVIIICFVYWYGCYHQKVISEPDRVGKDVLVVVCLATFIFLPVSNGLWDFRSVPKDPTLCFKSWHRSYDTFSFISLLTLPVQTNQLLLRTFNSFDFCNFVESLFFVINSIIDSERHRIRHFNSYMHTMALIIEGIWKW